MVDGKKIGTSYSTLFPTVIPLLRQWPVNKTVVVLTSLSRSNTDLAKSEKDWLLSMVREKYVPG